MLAYIKRKLSESEPSATNNNQNISSNCDEQNNNSGISSVIDSFVRQMSLTKSSSNYVEQTIPIAQDALLEELGYKNVNDLRETLYDLLRSIRDPEKPATLEDLDVVYEEGILILTPTKSNVHVVRIEFNPTVPHCSLATLIGLCIRIKVERSLPHLVKLDIYIKKGAHNTEDEINKQINDKERVAAAMENPNLRNLVENCIKDED